jgi:hypothetical protein
LIVILGVIIVIGFIAYSMFSSTSTSTTTKKEEFAPNAEQSVPKPVNPIPIAEDAFKKFNLTSSTSEEKMQQYMIAIENYQRAIDEGWVSDGAQMGQLAFNMASVYHQGVPETYANDIRKQGIPPDAQNAIMWYREAIRYGYYGALMPLASIYHWGLVGFAENREIASHLYGVVLKVGSDYEKGVAKDKLRQMREEEGKSLGSGMLLDEDGPVSTSFGVSGGGNPYEEHFMSLGKSQFDIGQDETTRGIDENYVNDLVENKLQIPKNRIDKTKKPSMVINSDPQNARDHVVVNSAKQSLERLRASTHIQHDVQMTFKMLHEYITDKCDLSEVKRETAAHVLKEMAKGIANLGYEQSKEIEALQLVWNRIQSTQDKEKRKMLMDNLVSELAECIEFGDMVCPTGRFNRIIDSLNFLDPMVQIQPQWAVRQTMVARAGAIQKELLDQCRADVRDAVKATKPNARERQLQNEFSQKLKSAIERDLTRSYVDSGLMTKEMLKVELDSWML